MMLADLGADVTRVILPAGERCRPECRSGSPVSPAVRDYLQAGKRTVSDGELDSLVARADLAVVDGCAHRVAEVRLIGGHLPVLSVTPYGLAGPLSAQAWTEFTAQAMSLRTMAEPVG